MRVRTDGAGRMAGEPGFGWELGLLVAGSAALLIAPALPLVDPEPVLAVVDPSAPAVDISGPDDVDPAFTAGPLLGLLALAPVALVVLFLVRSARSAALGLIVGLGALAPARAATDVQLLADAGRAHRPELFVPTSLSPLDWDSGALVLLVGHGLLLLAAVVAVVRWTGRTEAVGPVAGMDFDGPADRPRGSARRQGLLAATLCLGAVAGVGLLAAPFHSDNPFLLGESPLDGSAWTTAGGVLIAVATPVVAWLLASSPDPARGVGGVLGVALAVLAVVIPPLAVASAADDIDFAIGPLVAVLAVAAMVATAAYYGRDADPDHDGDEVEVTDRPLLPADGLLHRVTGAVAVLAGLAAFGGWVFDAIHSDNGLSAPEVGAARLLIPTAIGVGVLGLALLATGPRGGRLRPVLTVTLVAVPMAAAPVLDAALTARDYSGLEVGPGAWLSLVAMPIAGVAALLAAVAGGVERDDVDMSLLAQRRTDRVVLAAAGLAAALAVLAFALPLVDAPGYDAVAIWYGDGIASWGPIVALAAVLTAVGLAPWCRPDRAAALLLGAGLVLGMRVAQYALVERRVDGAEVDAGLWTTVAAAVVVLVAGGLAVRPGGVRISEPDEPGTTAARVPAGRTAGGAAARRSSRRKR